MAHRDDLAALGCAYFGPDLLRHRFRLPSLERPPDQLARKMRALATDLQAKRAAGQRILLSDENILGRPVPPHIAAGAQLYPAAALRIARLIAALGLQQVTLCLGIRAPADFLVSSHGHQAMAGTVLEYESYAKGIDMAPLRWSELIARLRRCDGVEHLLLWRFEDYTRLAPDLAAHLAGDARALAFMAETDVPRLVGPSARALEHAQSLLIARPDLPPGKAVDRAMRRFPKSTEYPALQPFAPELIAQAATRYQSDWQQLCELPGVTCLTP